MSTGSGLDVQVGAADEVYANEVQTWAVTGSPTGGSATLELDGADIGPLPYNSTNVTAQAVVDASPFGAGQIVITGGPWPGTALTATFSGATVAKRNQPAATLKTNALTGGTTPTVTVTTATPGTGYGDYVAPSRFVEHVDVDPKVQLQRVESRARRAGQMGAVRSDRQQTAVVGAGVGLSIEGVTKGLGFWLKHMVGAAPVITTPVGGTLTRDQTFTPGDYWNRSLTVQVGMPTAADIPEVVPFTYVGGKIPNWEIGCDVDGVLEIKVDIDAKDEDLSKPLAAAAFPSGMELLSWFRGSVRIDGKNYDVTNFRLTKPNTMNLERRFQRADPRKREPIINAATEATASMGAEFRDKWAYQKFLAGAPVSLVATFTAPTVIEGSLYPMLQITCPTVVFDDATPKLNGTDILMQDLPVKVLQPADGSPLYSIVFRSTDTAP